MATEAARGPGDLAPVLFYIPATASLLERRPRTLKWGDMFALFDHNGDIIAAPRSLDGIFFRDTRILSDFRLLINGARPLLLSSSVLDDNTRLSVDLTNPDHYREGVLQLAADTLHIRRTIFLWQDSIYERIAIANVCDRAIDTTLGLAFDADFIDLFELRGTVAKGHGTRNVRCGGPTRVEHSYTARDGQILNTVFDFDPAPTKLEQRAASWTIKLPARGRYSLFVRAGTTHDNTAPGVVQRDFFRALRKANAALRRSSARAAAVSSSNEIFNEMARRSVADLYMLMSEKPTGPYPYAGVPWFSTAFGRDGIITALEMLWADPEIARGVLRFLAVTQATITDISRDAEPGKIIHETREGELARLGEVPFGRYYGSVDATPLFVVLAGKYYSRTGDLDTIKALWTHIEAALRWIDTDGDPDQDGFVEYENRGGLANQGWKDSFDAVFHQDGTLAEGKIALAEVQAYVFAAKKEAAKLAHALGDAVRAACLEESAEALREKFEASFWCEEFGYYVLALDGRKRPCRVGTSNSGQVLFSGIASPERAARVVHTLMGRRYFSGWGIRTLAMGEPRYNPMSYHNGSVWPHDNALIARGFGHYGHKDEAISIFEGLFDAATSMELRRLPELFCGFARRPGRTPTLYPVACWPQAWASATSFGLVATLLGLSFHHETSTIRLTKPRLPDFIDDLQIRRLSLNGGSVDLELSRHGASVTANVLRRSGNLSVEVVV